MTYEELVDAIGPGFHPDTPGEAYASLPPGLTADEVDDVVVDAFHAYDLGGLRREDSPYDRALQRFIINGWVRVSSD